MVVLLAGGKSTRTTKMKQLYMVDADYLINLQIKKLLGYGFKVAVVLGFNFNKLKNIIDEDVVILENKNYEDGMFSSVKVACKELDVNSLLFCHIDRPIADKEVFDLLLDVDSDVAVAYKNYKKAPPIFIKSKMFNDLIESDFKRLDYWVESINSLTLVDVIDEKVHFNANTDLELKRYFD